MTKFGNSDHLLMTCMLSSKAITYGSPIWKLDKEIFGNEPLVKELKAKLELENAAKHWDG
ncbi:30444_t:CDS:1, partial [Gigaspora margarita]